MLLSGPAISGRAFSFFMSCIFTQFKLVRHFQVLHFHATLSGPSFSGRAFVAPQLHYVLFVMVALCNRAVALCNRADHYIFALLFLSSIYLFLFLA